MGIQRRRRLLNLPGYPQGQNIPRLARIVTDNLVSWWTFDGGYMTLTLVDRIGGNDGTIENAVAGVFWGNGKGEGILDGVDEFVNINDVLTNDLSTTTTGTWSGWVKPTDSTPSGSESIIAFGDTDADSHIFLFVTTAGVFVVQARNAGTNQWTLTTDNKVFFDGVWTHIVIAQDAIESVLYVDGVKVEQSFSVTTDKTIWFNDISGLDNGRIGDRNRSSGGETIHFDGSIGSILIYDRALSEAEVNQNFRAERHIYGI